MDDHAPGSTSITRDEVLNLIDRLVDKSLVQWDENRGYRLLYSVREHAKDELLEADDPHNIRLRHFEFHCQFAAATEERLRGPRQREWAIAYDAADEDFRLAFDWGFARPRHHLAAMEMTFDLTTHWFNSGRFAEGAYYYSRAIEVCPAEETDLRARLLRRGGMMKMYHGDADAGQLLEVALEMAKRVGSPQTLADAHFCYGLHLAADPDAMVHFEKSLDMFEELGDDVGLSFAVECLASRAYLNGRLEEARGYYGRVLEQRKAAGDDRGVGETMSGLALVEISAGNLELARGLLTEALDRFSKVGARFYVYSTLPTVALLAFREGHPEKAAILIGQSERLRAEARGIRDPIDNILFDRLCAAVTESLTKPLFTAFCHEGAVLSYDAGLGLAARCLSGTY